MNLATFKNRSRNTNSNSQHCPILPQPNHDNRIITTTMTAVESLRWALAVLTLLSALFVFLRLFCKKTRGRSVLKDDYTLIAAWVREQRW